MGYPIADEAGTPDGIGRFSRFTGGMIYWHPNYGAYPVSGSILAAWSASGFEKGKYGYPIGDEEWDDERLLSKQKFIKGELEGFSSAIVELSENMLGNWNGKLTPREIYDEGVQYAKESGKSPSIVFQEALAELNSYLNSRSLHPARNGSTAMYASIGPCQGTSGLPEGRDTDAINPRNRGDVFYSDSPTAGCNHGHNGIFVGDMNAKDSSRNDTIEAAGDFGSSSSSGDSNAGVRRKLNLPNDHPDRSHPPSLRNIKKMTVDASNYERHKAAEFAVARAGSGYDNPGDGYNYNFAFNKKNVGRWNCSSLIWGAYSDATAGRIDLDGNGGSGVYPYDIVESNYTSAY